MGDYTALTVLVKAPHQLMPAIEDVVMEYLNEHTRDPDPEKQPKATEVKWSGGDVRCGSADELATALRNLMRDGDEDREIAPTPFAYNLWEDPKYEWLGDLYIYVPNDVPGLAAVEYSSECDADGTTVVKPSVLLEAINEASDLDDAKARIGKIVGTEAEKAWEQYRPIRLPEQLTLPGTK